MSKELSVSVNEEGLYTASIFIKTPFENICYTFYEGKVVPSNGPRESKVVFENSGYEASAWFEEGSTTLFRMIIVTGKDLYAIMFFKDGDLSVEEIHAFEQIREYKTDNIAVRGDIRFYYSTIEEDCVDIEIFCSMLKDGTLQSIRESGGKLRPALTATKSVDNENFKRINEWRVNGLLQNENDEPSVILTEEVDGTVVYLEKHWYKDGERHRESKNEFGRTLPAITGHQESTNLTVDSWWQNGKLFRELAPPIVFSDCSVAHDDSDVDFALWSSNFTEMYKLSMLNCW